jgi:hypothetical protein
VPECRPALAELQSAFAAYIRDPEHNPPPADVDERRMSVYRKLFFNNIQSFLAASFPVLRQVVRDELWHELAQGFFARHRSRSPYFSGIAEEFLDYLQNERPPRPDDSPFLLELAHYEWVELALAVAEGEAPAPDADLHGSPLGHSIALSALAWPLAYRFPVHHVAPAFQPQEPADTPSYLVAYRDRDDEVRFLEINHVTYRLLQIVDESGPCWAEDVLRQIATELQRPDPETVIRGGTEILQGLIARGIIGRGKPA